MPQFLGRLQVWERLVNGHILLGVLQILWYWAGMLTDWGNGSKEEVSGKRSVRYKLRKREVNTG